MPKMVENNVGKVWTDEKKRSCRHVDITKSFFWPLRRLKASGWCHDIQHNNTKHYYTQHNDTQHDNKNTPLSKAALNITTLDIGMLSVIMLSVANKLLCWESVYRMSPCWVSWLPQGWCISIAGRKRLVKCQVIASPSIFSEKIKLLQIVFVKVLQYYDAQSIQESVLLINNRTIKAIWDVRVQLDSLIKGRFSKNTSH
jgi:hypothetical protein